MFLVLKVKFKKDKPAKCLKVLCWVTVLLALCLNLTPTCVSISPQRQLERSWAYLLLQVRDSVPLCLQAWGSTWGIERSSMHIYPGKSLYFPCFLPHILSSWLLVQTMVKTPPNSEIRDKPLTPFGFHFLIYVIGFKNKVHLPEHWQIKMWDFQFNLDSRQIWNNFSVPLRLCPQQCMMKLWNV